MGTCSSITLVLASAFMSCTYGPSKISVEISNLVARPNSHVFAIGSIWKRERDPQGFLATFPDGGKKKVLELEARVYVVDVGTREITSIVQIREFPDIPRLKSVHIEGWKGEHLYVRLFGYDGSDWRGDDIGAATIFRSLGGRSSEYRLVAA